MDYIFILFLSYNSPVLVVEFCNFMNKFRKNNRNIFCFSLWSYLVTFFEKQRYK
jgi:hypothetical protein